MILVLFLLLGVSHTASAQHYVAVQPAKPVIGAKPASPAPGYVWVGEEWKWINGKYVWVGAHWMPPPYKNAVWVHGHWKKNDHGWYWTSGHWVKRY